MAILSGRTGKLNIGTMENIPATNVSVNSKADTLDTTNFMNQGYASHAIGMYSAEITCDVLAVESGYGLKPGATGQIQIVDDSTAASPGVITITNCVLTNVSYDANAKDVQKMSLTFATYGAYSVLVG